MRILCQVMRNSSDGPVSRNLPYRLAAIDIDETLIVDHKGISALNRNAVAALRSAGVRVMLASGRGHHNMLPFHRSLGLDGHIVSVQGALVKHAETGEILYEKGLSRAEATLLINEGLDRGHTVLCFCRDGVYSDKLDHWTQRYVQDSGDDAVHVADVKDLIDRKPLKVIWAAPPDQVAAFAPRETHRFAGQLNVMITNPYYLEFNAIGADKAAGVSAVAAHLGMEPQQVMAFGDGNNDVSLLAWAGLSIAMHDGRPSAKAVAKRISPPGDPATSLGRAIFSILGQTPIAHVA